MALPRPAALQVATDLLGLRPALRGRGRGCDGADVGVVALGGRARFLLPLASPAVTRAACLAYVRLRDQPTVAQRVAVATAFRLRGDRFVAPSRLRADDGPDGLLAHIADQVGQPQVAVAMGLGTVDAVWKPTLHVFDTAGTPLAFVKVGLGPVAASLVAREAEVLARWADHPDPRIVVPRLSGTSTWRKVPLVLVAPLPADVRRLPAPVSAWPVHTLDDAVADRPLAAAEWWTSRRTITEADTGADTCAGAGAHAGRGTPTVAQLLDRIEQRHGGVDLQWARWHGDWVLWNQARCSRGLVAWDWEYSEPAAPAGLDEVHGRYQQVRVVDGRPINDALAAARRAAPTRWLADAHVAMLLTRDAELARLAGEPTADSTQLRLAAAEALW